MTNRIVFLAAATALSFGATQAAAQSFPSAGGLEARIGVAAPENARAGLSASADLDLGSLGIGSLRTLVGGHYFAVNRTHEGAGDPGSYNAVGGRLGFRLDVFGRQRISPYLLAAVTGHQVSAEVEDAQVGELLSGFYSGASLGAGVAYKLDAAGRTAVTGEARSTFASNIQHLAFEVGLRYMPRGPQSYARAPRTSDGRDAVQVDRDRTNAERLEAERLERARLEQERLERERLARAAQDDQQRAAQQTDQARQQAELARQRAAAAEEARRQEEEARLRAEQAAREAEARAAAAEQRLYDSLLDLHRLITNVTAVRETERGLAVVVGAGLFASGQHSLSTSARAEVGRIAAVLMQYPDHRIAVEGHTDAVGAEASNQTLSEQRAASVRAALIAEGIDPARVTAVGFGQSRPIAGNDTAADRAQNRRVEIVILGARRPDPR
jgi:outer membrane protein OmpA-like peptidoglycan-associated protein